MDMLFRKYIVKDMPRERYCQTCARRKISSVIVPHFKIMKAVDWGVGVARQP